MDAAIGFAGIFGTTAPESFLYDIDRNAQKLFLIIVKLI